VLGGEQYQRGWVRSWYWVTDDLEGGTLLRRHCIGWRRHADDDRSNWCPRCQLLLRQDALQKKTPEAAIRGADAATVPAAPLSLKFKWCASCDDFLPAEVVDWKQYAAQGDIEQERALRQGRSSARGVSAAEVRAWKYGEKHNIKWDASGRTKQVEEQAWTVLADEKNGKLRNLKGRWRSLNGIEACCPLCAKLGLG
jgi:hypothetical protein